MKARLEDLQAKVQYHERLGQMNNGSLEKAIDMTSCHRNGLGGGQAAIAAPHNMVDMSQKPQATQMISPRLLQPTYFEHSIDEDEDDGPLYLQHSQLIDSTESQQQQQQQRGQQHQQYHQHQQHQQHEQHGSKSQSLTPDLADHGSKPPDKTQPVFKNLWNKRKRMTFQQSDVETNDTERMSMYFVHETPLWFPTLLKSKQDY